jgi:threonine dehydrogenase-like Zn-dependent dehydrogenase
MGAQTLPWSRAADVIEFARRWAGPGGPPAVFEASGTATAVRAMVDMIASAGRAVQVGMSSEEAAIRVGSLTEKEIDLLGVSCCGQDEFVTAIEVVERNTGLLARLISHEFPLQSAPEAIRFAIASPAAVMKVVIRAT